MDAAAEKKYFYLMLVRMTTDNAGKRSYGYLEITEAEATSGTLTQENMEQAHRQQGLLYWNVRFANAYPGWIVKAEGPPDQEEGKHVIYDKRGILLGPIQDADARTTWRALYDAEERSVQQKKRIEEARNVNPVYESLGPLRTAYKASSPAKRQQMLADFLRFITS